MNQDIEAEGPTPESVNVDFVEQHLRHRWLSFSQGGQPLAHTEAILAAASEHGLTLQRTGKNVLLFHGGRCVGGVMGATPSMNSSFAQLIASSKNLTKGVLKRAGVPTPAARQFSESEWAPASAYLTASAGRRHVVKPADGRQGLGITTGVRTEDDLRAAWHHAMAASRSKRLLVEAEVPGVDVRVLVIQGRAEAAATRIPPFVVGDGRHSIRELTAQLEDVRRGHVYLKDRAVTVDEAYLGRHQRSPRDVLGAGEVQFLNGTANLSQGGVSVDLTDTIPAEVMALAEAAAAAVPGLNFAGVDILVPDLRTAHGATVIEVNTSPNVLVHEAPAYGRARSVADTVVRTLIGSNGPEGSGPDAPGSGKDAWRGRRLLARVRAARLMRRSR